MRILHWFRSDLRVSDNTSLARAAQDSSRGVVCVYVISPAEWKAHDIAAAQIDFRLRCLSLLSEELTRLGIPLKVLSVDVETAVAPALVNLARTLHADAISFNREYELDESRRDDRVCAAFRAAGLQARAYSDQSFMEPDAIRTQAGSFYTVFTPYKKAWIRTFDELTSDGDPLKPHAIPRRQAPLDVSSDPVPAAAPGCIPHVDRSQLRSLWPAGEHSARKRLAAFIADDAAEYGTRRDLPALESTSRLSPALAVGAISVRQCLRAAIEANSGLLDTGSKGISTWISELIWREFYIHVTAGFPQVCRYRAFKPETERILWIDNPEHLNAWRRGLTGYPIVDAAMRQLQSTAWMHNRLRMIAAMFLAKDLLIDWRLGEKHFMLHLIDCFFPSNNGGWQWSASTGTDAVPYFRIFNPASQSAKCDPEGKFIRSMVPELAGVSSQEIHDPPPLLRARLGYPLPIVDHAKARDRVLAAFKSL